MVEAADADTYICEARFADATVLTAATTLEVIGEMQGWHTLKKLVPKHALNRMQLYLMQVPVTRNFKQTQPISQTTQFWSGASVQVSGISLWYTFLVRVSRILVLKVLVS